MGNTDLIKKLSEQLHVAEMKLMELERLKKLEPSLRKEVKTVSAQLEQAKSEQAFFVDKNCENTSGNSPDLKPIKRSELFKTDAEAKEDNRKKRIKTLVKKIQQVEALKNRPDDELDADMKTKLAQERLLRKELAALERGEEWTAEEDDEESVMLPTDKDEREKLAKNLRKKLTQIEGLKGKDNLDTDAKEKVANEHRVRQQLEALEGGQYEAAIKAPPPKDAAEVIADERKELDKKIKTLTKKLDAIKRLKDSGRSLSDEEKKKVASESDLKKQRKTLEVDLAAVDKKEQERVFERLGWEDETKKKKNKA